MKTVLLFASAITLLVSSLLAQENPQPPRRIAAPAPSGGEMTADERLRRRREESLAGSGVPGGAEVPADAARFDLKFPGGKVKEFVAAVAKALGKPVNVIIPKEGEGTLIPAVEVARVTVRELFYALGSASQHEVLVLSAPRSSNYQFKSVGFNFRCEEANPSPDAVWTFHAVNVPDFPVEAPVLPARTVQYYPVAEYLSHFSVEDITTAIEAGWNLQSAPTNPPATIRFHEETKLLICAGTKAQIELVPQILQGLSIMLQYPRTENLKITRKAGGIIVPKLDFKEATPREAVDFIRRKAGELDPEKQGFNIVLRLNDGEQERRVTLALSQVPALEALKYVAALSGLELEIDDHAIVLCERPLRATPAFAPVPADAFPLPGYPVPPTPLTPPAPSNPPAILNPPALPGLPAK